MASEGELVDFAKEILAAQRMQVVKYFVVASVSLLSWDYILTIRGEVSLIWPTKWSWTKFLFFVSRYLPFASASLSAYYYTMPGLSVGPEYSACKVINETMTWLLIPSILASETILIIRTYIIYGRKKKLLAILLGLIFLATPTIIVINYYFLRTVQYLPQPIATLAGCYFLTDSINGFIPFLFLLFLEILIVLLTVRRGYTQMRTSGSTLTKTLYIDGVFFFFFTLFFTVLNCIVMAALPGDYADLLITMQASVHSITSTRILLNLHEANPANHTEDEISLGPVSEAEATEGFSAHRRASILITKTNVSDATNHHGSSLYPPRSGRESATWGVEERNWLWSGGEVGKVEVV